MSSSTVRPQTAGESLAIPHTKADSVATEPTIAPVGSDFSANDPAVESSAPLGKALARLSHPEQTRQPVQVVWAYVAGIVGVHLLALLAFDRWLFSWSGVALAFAGLYVFGTLGINLCYHRLLTHQGFTCPKWLEHTFATLGVCCMQDTPARWVAIHRIHHKHSDEQPDPHSPLVNVLWGHMGWLFVENRDVNNAAAYERYARDVLRDPFYFRFERRMAWLTTYLWHALAFYLVGALIGSIWTRSLMGGVQLGLSWVVWGVFVRTVAVWHITWSVNSLSHVWGYQTYQTGENSRNNWFVALVSNGEGWHNNHHFDQRAAAHGHRWWEFDVTWITIRVLSWLGLAHDVVLPRSWSDSRRAPAAPPQS